MSSSGNARTYFGAYFIIFSEFRLCNYGDAAVQENRELVIANPNFCLDIEKAKQSLNRIKSFKAAQYYCYHGGKLTV